MGSNTDVYGLFPSTLTIPLGITLPVLMEAKQLQTSGALEYLSGGTLWILGITYGQTLAADAAATVFAGGTFIYNVQSGRAINIDGAPRFYLAATGATVVCQLLRGLGPGSVSQGYTNAPAL